MGYLKHSFILPALVMAVVLSAQNSRVPANDPLIVYEGRHAVDADGAVRFGFPGLAVHLRFRGEALTLQATASSEDVFFDVSVDDAPPTVLRLRSGAGNYEVWRSEGTAEHTVTLTRRTESWQGVGAFVNFALNEKGEWLAPAPLPDRKLLFIGDSVTCGEMTAFAPKRERKDKLNNNADLAYGKVLARRLGAQCHLVSYGGRGVIRDWQGISATANAPQFYELALPDDPAVHWDHRRYVPDVIGIQLGTNDFSSGIPDEHEFVTAYVEFVRKLRRDAPAAPIFLMDSPILNDDAERGPRRTVLRNYLAQIIARLADDKVVFAPLRHYPGVPDNGHPTGAEHAAMADELEPLWRRALGW